MPNTKTTTADVAPLASHDRVAVDSFLRGANLFSSALLRVLEEELRADTRGQVSGAGFAVLRLLERREISRVGDIVRRLEVSYSTASKLADRLVKDGLVLRSEDPTDRRAAQLELSPDGLALIGRYEASIREATRQLISDIPAEALPQVGPMLESLAIKLLEMVLTRGQSCIRYSTLALLALCGLDAGSWAGMVEWMGNSSS